MSKKKPVPSVAVAEGEWEQYALETTWDMGDAMRTSAQRANPSSDVRMVCLNGTYRVLIRRVPR